jgi:hypothetical protein
VALYPISEIGKLRLRKVEELARQLTIQWQKIGRTSLGLQIPCHKLPFLAGTRVKVSLEEGRIQKYL